MQVAGAAIVSNSLLNAFQRAARLAAAATTEHAGVQVLQRAAAAVQDLSKSSARFPFDREPLLALCNALATAATAQRTSQVSAEHECASHVPPGWAEAMTVAFTLLGQLAGTTAHARKLWDGALDTLLLPAMPYLMSAAPCGRQGLAPDPASAEACQAVSTALAAALLSPPHLHAAVEAFTLHDEQATAQEPAAAPREAGRQVQQNYTRRLLQPIDQLLAQGSTCNAAATAAQHSVGRKRKRAQQQPAVSTPEGKPLQHVHSYAHWLVATFATQWQAQEPGKLCSVAQNDHALAPFALAQALLSAVGRHMQELCAACTAEQAGSSQADAPQCQSDGHQSPQLAAAVRTCSAVLHAMLVSKVGFPASPADLMSTDE